MNSYTKSNINPQRSSRLRPSQETSDRKPFIVSRPSKDFTYGPRHSSKDLIKRIPTKQNVSKKTVESSKPPFILPGKSSLQNFNQPLRSVKNILKEKENKWRSTSHQVKSSLSHKVKNKQNDNKENKQLITMESPPQSCITEDAITDWRKKFASFRNRSSSKPEKVGQTDVNNENLPVEVVSSPSIENKPKKTPRKSVHFAAEEQGKTSHHPHSPHPTANYDAFEPHNSSVELNNFELCADETTNTEKSRTYLAGNTPYSTSSGSCGHTPGRKNFPLSTLESPVIQPEESQVEPENVTSSSHKKRRSTNNYRRKSIKSPFNSNIVFSRQKPDSHREPYYLRSTERKPIAEIESTHKFSSNSFSFSKVTTSSPNDIADVSETTETNENWFVPESPLFQKSKKFAY